jgi:hypothetical protein
MFVEHSYDPPSIAGNTPPSRASTPQGMEPPHHEGRLAVPPQYEAPLAPRENRRRTCRNPRPRLTQYPAPSSSQWRRPFPTFEEN